MSPTVHCDFTLRHYGEILDAAEAAGYRVIGFAETTPARQRAVLLRHDLDFSIDAALPMAELEAKRGIASTYFVLPSSPTYSPFEPKQAATLRRLYGLGHRIGVHLDERILEDGASLAVVAGAAMRLRAALAAVVPVEPVVSFHMPTAAVLGRRLHGVTSTYAPRFFQAMPYRSDSARHWREGCVCELLRTAPPMRLHLLVHPIWWSMRERNAKQVWSALRDSRSNEVNAYLRGFRPFASQYEPEEKAPRKADRRGPPEHGAVTSARSAQRRRAR